MILDLPSLTTILLNGGLSLAGDDHDNNKIVINGHNSYNNILILRSNICFT